MSDGYKANELHRFVDWINDRAYYAPAIIEALYAEAEQIEAEERKAAQLESALRLGRDLAKRARKAEEEGRNPTLTEHTFRVLEDAGVLGIPEEV